MSFGRLAGATSEFVFFIVFKLKSEIINISLDSDVLEDDIMNLSEALLRQLLVDQSRKLSCGKEGNLEADSNIFWATDIYEERYGKGNGFDYNDPITLESITGKNAYVIQPRMRKSLEEQVKRSREKGEVFTPSWLCNKQINSVDETWFGHGNVFNKELDNQDGTHEWVPFEGSITFPEGKANRTWQDYVMDVRLEITCGEAPYLVSRYDTISGQFIPISHRIGMLDRKLRVVCENCDDEESWLSFAKRAYQSIYGYDWQGDNVLIARESLLISFLEYYKFKFGNIPSIAILLEISDIISWNIWQMDGLKCVVPDSCHDSIIDEPGSLFKDMVTKTTKQCEGCSKNKLSLHNGIKCYVKDWKTNELVLFSSLVK